MPLATQPIECDAPFEFECDVVKAVEEDGKWYLEGVASGVLEDADGERVTKRAIVDMARQAVKGLKLVAGSHVHDWHNEFGEVVKVAHLPETDELHVRAQLEDGHPYAELAKKRALAGEPLAFSIGGKLKSFFYEFADGGRRRRKALDKIALKHMTVTKRPSYQHSFATAVAKTAPLDTEPDDAAFTRDLGDEPVEKIIVVREDVEKDASAVSQDNDAGGSAGDRGKGKRNLSADDAGADKPADKPDKDLPKAAGRRLACPNCGHEFAAEVPEDQDPEADASGDNDDQEAKKRASEEDDMSIESSLDKLRSLTAEEEGVEKTAEETAAEEEAAAKTGDDDVDVAKLERMIAAAHSSSEDAIAEIRGAVGDGFELVAKSHQRIMEVITAMPQGRRSIARVHAQGNGTPRRSETEEGTPVAKRVTTDPLPEGIDDTVAKAIGETDDPVARLKLINFGTHGVASTGVG